MAKRLTDTDKWKKQWFRTMPPEYKCFWHFILDYSDFAGIWDVDFGLAEFYIGRKIDPDKIKSFFTKQIIIIAGGKRWFIIDFIVFQYGKKLKINHAFHSKIIERLKEHDLLDKFFYVDEQYYCIREDQTTLFDTLSDTLSTTPAYTHFSKKGKTAKIDTVSHTVSDTVSYENNNKNELNNTLSHTLSDRVKEKEKEIDKEKEEEKEMTHEFQIFVKELKNVSQIKTQLTFDQSVKLEKKYGIQLVKKILTKMENHKNLSKKYMTVHLTCDDWCERESKTHQNGSKQNGIHQNGAGKKVIEPTLPESHEKHTRTQ